MKNILASACLLALIGCSTDKLLHPVAIKDQIVKDTPPDELLQLCEAVTVHKIETTKDLVVSHQSYKKAFCDCSARQASLVSWYQNKTLDSAC